jgi:putative membrane protein
MNETMQTDSKFEVEPNVSNHFAWIRTMLGLQRTLMAAVRTSVSLIGFGFTVAQFFEKLRSNAPESVRTVRINAPRDLGLLLIAAGVISLFSFIWQYREAVKYMKSGDLAGLVANTKTPLHNSTYLAAYTVLGIGIAAFVSVLARF